MADSDIAHKLALSLGSVTGGNISAEKISPRTSGCKKTRNSVGEREKILAGGFWVWVWVWVLPSDRRMPGSLWVAYGGQRGDGPVARQTGFMREPHKAT